MKTSLKEVIESTVQIPCDDVILQGVLAIPADAAGLVIFAHGSGSSRFSPRNRMVASRMWDRKLGTLLFDLMTEQEATSDKTAELRFDIPFLTKRLISVTRWAQANKRSKELSIGYFGASTGAAAALAAAAAIPEIQAVVSRGGRTDLADHVISWVDTPTLLIVGEKDHPVIEWNRNSFRQMKCVKEIAMVPGATHLFEEKGALEEVADLAASWFKVHFSKTPRS